SRQCRPPPRCNRRIPLRRLDRPSRHVEMQLAARIRIARDEFLVEHHPEPGLGRRNHVTLLPPYRLLQDLSVKAVPALDALEDQEIRAAGGELDIGGA